MAPLKKMCSNYFLKETYGSQTVEYYRYMTSKLLIKLNLKSLSLSPSDLMF